MVLIYNVVLIYNQDNTCEQIMTGHRKTPKRAMQIGVKISPEDLGLCQRAGERLWEGMPFTNSTLLMALAVMQAKQVLKEKK